jgi:DNA replication protein DnaC
MPKKLYNEEHLLESLGVDGYRWFIDRYSRRRCEQCQGACEIKIENSLTGKPSMANCPDCWDYSGRLQRFTKLYFDSVPPKYRGLYFSNLNASPKSSLPIETQNEIIKTLKSNPDDSYAFFGPAGTSKSTWLTVMYVNQLWRHVMGGERNSLGKKLKWFSVQRITAKRLLDQFSDYAIHKNDQHDDNSSVAEPVVTREKVEACTKNGVKFHLFLDELDKIKETETRYMSLFDVIDAIYEHEGQLVISSNLRPAEFENQFGAQFMRRIEEMCNKVNLFNDK